MSSRQDSNRWEFKAALAFAEFCKASRCHSTHRKALTNPSEPQVQSLPSFKLQEVPKRDPHLGDFEAVYKGLAEFDRLQLLQKREEQKNLRDAKDSIGEHEPPDEESSPPGSDLAPPLTPLDEEADLPIDTIQLKEVRWEDDISGSYVYMRRAQRQGINDVADRQKYLAELKTILGSDEPAVLRKKENAHQVRRRAQSPLLYKHQAVEDDEFEPEPRLDPTLVSEQRPVLVTSQKMTTPTTKLQGTVSATQLTPAWVTPVPVRLNRSLHSGHLENRFFDGTNTTRILYLKREQKKAAIITLLSRKLGPHCFGHPNLFQAINVLGGNLAEEGIHVFVDSSNITIGFHDSIRAAESNSLGNVSRYGRRAPLSFHILAFIMERGRNVAKRILVGSLDGSRARPEYMKEAERCGYEINALERVSKFKEHWPNRSSGSNGNGYCASGQSSGSETGRVGRMRFTEQAVDEILHMKMLESMLDYAEKPSTIVLATGDAAEAEFSGGFLLMVRRALVRGWKVELVAWGHSMNHLYRSNDFQLQWKAQFTVIELEDFAQLLLDNYG